MKLSLLASCLLIAVAGSAQTVENFTLTDVTNNTPVSLNSFSTAPCVVILFSSNACPFDQYYRDRVNDLVSAYSGRIPILLVNAHQEPAEDANQMVIAATQWKTSVPYLADKQQLVMGALHAKRSPEAFVLKPEHGKFSVLYNGAIDDNPMEAGSVNEHYLKNAIDKVLAGQKPHASSTRGAGCTIKKK